MVERVENREKIPDKAVSQSTMCLKVHTFVLWHDIMESLPVPVSSFPFPNYHPDAGTGSDFPNRTFVGPLVQPLFKQASRRLTLLHTCVLAVHRSQLAAPTSCKFTPTSYGQ
jgi:hypothetical protein